MVNDKMTSVGVSRKLLSFLSSKGIYGETYEKIIWRLILKQQLTATEIEEIKEITESLY